MLWLVQRAFETLGIYRQFNKEMFLSNDRKLVNTHGRHHPLWLSGPQDTQFLHLIWINICKFTNSFSHPGSLIQSKQWVALGPRACCVFSSTFEAENMCPDVSQVWIPFFLDIKKREKNGKEVLAWRTPWTVWKVKRIWHWKMSPTGQNMSIMLLVKSREQLQIAPTRLKWLGQSGNDTLLWMCLMWEYKVQCSEEQFFIDLWSRSYLNGLVVFHTYFNLSLNLAIRSSWSEPQSAPGLVFADSIELLQSWLQRM